VREYLSNTFGGTASLWSLGLAALGVFLILAPLPSGYALLKVLVACILFLIAIIVILTVRSYQFFQNFKRPIKLIRIVQGYDILGGRNIFVLENPGWIRENTLATLYSTSSGTVQPVGFIKITRCVPKEDLQAVTYPPGAPDPNLTFLGARDFRETAIFASPVIHTREFEDIQAAYTLSKGETGETT